MNLAEYLKPLDVTARTALAVGAGTSYLHLRNIAFSGKSCGAALAVELERATAGNVRRWDLRPNDWHRIWPELIGPKAPPVPVEQTQEAA